MAATNADLVAEVRERRFRADLFFRLRVIPFAVPPLREHRDDVEPLLANYMAHYAEAYGLPRIRFTAAALELVRAYSWPGNVRELENSCATSPACNSPARSTWTICRCSTRWRPSPAGRSRISRACL